MILLDSDVLVVDLRYKQDARFPINRQVLQLLQSRPGGSGIAAQALLEVVGILSFNVPAGQVVQLADQVCLQYGLTVLPDLQQHPGYAGCSTAELIVQMSRQMSLSDAVQAVQIAHHAPFAEALVSWNARHFVGKLVIPVLTPADWLTQQPDTVP